MPDYGAGVGDDASPPMPVMLPPPAVMLSPVTFWATAGVAIETGPTTAAMPNAATIATAASMIFVFIAIEGNAIHYIRIYNNNDLGICLVPMSFIENRNKKIKKERKDPTLMSFIHSLLKNALVARLA